MTESFMVRSPKAIRIIGIVNYSIGLGIFAYSLVFGNNPVVTILFGFFCAANLFIFLIPLLKNRLEITPASIIIHRFPFATRTLAWQDVETIQGRRYVDYIRLWDKKGKSINLGVFEFCEKFYESLQANRPSLFPPIVDSQLIKRPWIWS